MHLLVEAGLLPDGTRLRMEPGHGTTPSVRDDIATWLADDDRRRWVRWQNKKVGPLRWMADDAEYSATGLTAHVFSTVTGAKADGIQGTAWWVVDDDSAPAGIDPGDWADLQDRTLVQLTDDVKPGMRDWSDLHTVLAGLAPGRWTSYGDLAAAIGSHPVPVGSHLAGCRSCPNPWRVLNADGRVSPGSGGRTRPVVIGSRTCSPPSTSP